MKLKTLFRISVDKKKGLIGFGLGLLSLCVLYLLRNVYIASESDGLTNGWLLGFPLVVAFTVLGFLRIESEHPVVCTVLNICWSLVSAVAAILGVMAAVECLGIWRMPLYNILLNVAFFFACVGIAYTATGRFRRSVNIVSGFQFVVSMINSFVWQFRGRELLFSDLSAAGTALTVVQEYSPVFSLKMAMGMLLWLMVVFSQFSLPRDTVTKNWKSRCAAILAAAGLFAFTVFGSVDIPIQTWASRGSGVNGFYINFMISIRNAMIRPPENYSEAAVEAIVQDYTDPQDSGAADAPNIIVIMNESFVDFRVLGENFNTNESVLPFFDSLQENTVRGYALTSAYGGHTANAEFEFLTGLSMGMLPVGSTPYQQYISRDTFSMVWLMEQYGYRCSSTHPYFARGWARENTYPLLGFQESTFIDDYPQENLLREWVSDQEMYEYVVDMLENADSRQPQFLFGITMQNHGGYNYVGPNYTQTIELEGYSAEYPWAEQYLSVLHESDKALEYLLTYLENCGKDTVVVFFGDHFPSVETGLYNEILGGGFDTLDKQILQYKVPFLIWANYDIEEAYIDCTSLNYLGNYLLQAAGLERPAYYQFLAELEAAIPAMNAMGYYSLTQNCFLTYDQAQGAEKEWLDKYAMIQYNSLFDEETRSSAFFEKYLPAIE